MATANPTQELFDLWRRSVEESTQAWVRAFGQAPAVTVPPVDPGQLWRPLLAQGLEAWQKLAAQGKATPDLVQQFKALMDQSIEAWSAALGQAMSTEEFAQALSRYLDQYLALHAPAKKALEQYNDLALKTLGLPSRGQVVGVAAQVVGLEERIERLEDRLDELKALVEQTLRAVNAHETAAQRRAAPAKEDT